MINSFSRWCFLTRDTTVANKRSVTRKIESPIDNQTCHLNGLKITYIWKQSSFYITGIGCWFAIQKKYHWKESFFERILVSNWNFEMKLWVICLLQSKYRSFTVMLHSGGEFLSIIEWFSVRQGTQHFTDENKVSRKWSDSVHLLPFQLSKNNTITHWVLIVKIQNQKSFKLSYNNIYYKTHSQLFMRPTINQ